MEINPLPLCDEDSSNSNLRKLIESMNFSDSSEQNFRTLMEITTHLRQKIIPKYEERFQNLKITALSLLEKKTFLLEDLQKIKIIKNELLGKSMDIADKYESIKAKQSDLLKRSEKVVHEIHSRKSILSLAEKEFVQTLKNTSIKLDSFRKDMDVIYSKRESVELHENLNINYDIYYLHNWQVKIIRDGLDIIGKEIMKLIDDVASIDKEFNDHVDNIFLNEMEQC